MFSWMVDSRGVWNWRAPGRGEGCSSCIVNSRVEVRNLYITHTHTHTLRPQHPVGWLNRHLEVGQEQLTVGTEPSYLLAFSWCSETPCCKQIVKVNKRSIILYAKAEIFHPRLSPPPSLTVDFLLVTSPAVGRQEPADTSTHVAEVVWFLHNSVSHCQISWVMWWYLEKVVPVRTRATVAQGHGSTEHPHWQREHGSESSHSSMIIGTNN